MTLSQAVDTALDRTVVLGYGSVGFNVRRMLPDWPADPPRMDGRVVLVTGVASGIGLAAARGFARLGASVRALARSQERAQRAVADIAAACPGADVRPAVADLSSLSEILDFAERFTAEEERLDVLVNNAGVMPAERSRSVDGHELMFATHVLAPFALIACLRGAMEANASACVINVSSGGMYEARIPAGDLESDRVSYNPKRLYARTKREQVTISEIWAERLRGTGVVVHAMHPGWVDTHGVRASMPVFRVLTAPILRTPEQGADTIVWLGGASEALGSTGCFWHDRRARPTHYLVGAARDSEHARRELWDHCEAALARARALRAGG